MTGEELKDLRISTGKSRSEFYHTIKVQPSYASPIELYYGDRQIPQRLEIKVRKRYKKLLTEV